MNKRERLKRLLHDFTETDDVLVESFKSFDSEIARLKSQLKEKVNIRTLNNVNDELNKFREKLDLPAIANEFNRLKDDISDHVQQALHKCELMLSEFEKSADDITQSVSESRDLTKRKIDELSNELRQTRVRMSSLQEDIFADLSKKIKEIKTEIDAKLSDDLDTEQTKDLIAKLEDEINKLRSEFVEKLSNVQSGLNSSRGGAMNRQMLIASVDVLKTYTDINFIAGSGVTISAANNNVTKKVDITFTASGSSSGFQRPLTGIVNGSNTVFTWTTAPNALMTDRIPMQKVSSDGTINWIGTTTTTLTAAPFDDLYAVA